MSKKYKKLMPCPFCGFAPEEVVHSPFFSKDIYYTISCINGQCSIHPTTGNFFSEGNCLDAWNTRSTIL